MASSPRPVMRSQKFIFKLQRNVKNFQYLTKRMAGTSSLLQGRHYFVYVVTVSYK